MLLKTLPFTCRAFGGTPPHSDIGLGYFEQPDLHHAHVRFVQQFADSTLHVVAAQSMSAIGRIKTEYLPSRILCPTCKEACPYMSAHPRVTPINLITAKGQKVGPCVLRLFPIQEP
jgi:hypothetical protein